MIHQILRGEATHPAGFRVHVGEDRIVYAVGPWAVGTLYLRTKGGARTDGVIGVKHAPAANTPSGELRDFDAGAVSFTADGHATLDLVGIGFVVVTPTTKDTGSGWTVEGIMHVQGDTP